jgi:hypothetical protein
MQASKEKARALSAALSFLLTKVMIFSFTSPRRTFRIHFSSFNPLQLMNSRCVCHQSALSVGTIPEEICAVVVIRESESDEFIGDRNSRKQVWNNK